MNSKTKGLRGQGKLARFWSIYKKNKIGVFALFVLIFFLLIAAFGQMIVAYNPQQFGSARDMLQPPSAKHILGTDDMGRDLLQAMVFGTRSTMLVGIFGTLISMFIGSAIGIASGYGSKRLDSFLMRITDIMLVLPWLPLMLVMAALLGSSIWNIILVIGITGWSQTARIVRAQTLSIKERQYIERARAIGSSSTHIIVKHILPDVFPLICANAVITAACSIDAETTLSFLGMGDVSKPSWGMILHYAFESGAASNNALWYIIPPGLCVLLVVLSFSYVGNAFDEISNPRLRQRE
jgi:peptide/nickel transport system permease protein